jgi:putative acetyltransferase
MITIRKTTPVDLETILQVELAAFKNDRSIKKLVTDLLKDPSAEPRVSLLAYDGDKAVGHILFTRAKILAGLGFCSLKGGYHILAPLAVIPEYQKQGVGGLLIKEGLRILMEMGTERCFVLGHKDYYPRHGFIPNAIAAGWPAPYPIPEENHDAWMWQDLVENPSDTKGRVICAEAMLRKEYWRE